MGYICPDIRDQCVECEGCQYEQIPVGESPCKPGECVRDGACYEQ